MPKEMLNKDTADETETIFSFSAHWKSKELCSFNVYEVKNKNIERIWQILPVFCKEIGKMSLCAA